MAEGFWAHEVTVRNVRIKVRDRDNGKLLFFMI